MKRSRLGIAVAITAIGSIALTACGSQHAREIHRSAPHLKAFDERPSFATAYEAYSPAKRATIQTHLKRAISRLRDRTDEFQVAAAINSYLFQYLRPGQSTGDGADVLRAARAVCGGHQEAMEQMLWAAGIRSRDAYLVGIPTNGTHAMVEVYFKNGGEGLFDPTYGSVWWDSSTSQPVPMTALLRRRPLVDSTRYQTVDWKHLNRREPLHPIASFEQGYRHATSTLVRFHQNPKWPAKWQDMDYDTSFADADIAGIADDTPSTAVIPLSSGRILGTLQWVRDKHTLPWMSLIRQAPRESGAVWAYELGRFDVGYNLRHSYAISGLRPGRRYRLQWAFDQLLSGHLFARVHGSARKPSRIVVPEHPFVPGAKPLRVSFGFRAAGTAQRIELSTDGSGILQGIAVDPAPRR